MTLKSSLLFASRLIFPRASVNSSARRSVLGAILCIGISIVPLVVVLSVSDGMISGMTKRIIGLGSCDIQAFLPRSGSDAKSSAALKEFSETFSDIDGVTGIYPQIECDALATGKNYRTGARVRAVNPEIFKTNDDFSKLFEVLDGSTERFSSDKKSAVIGQKMAELLSLKAGDTFRLVTTSTNSSGAISPKVSVFRVAAVVSSGYQELDSLWVFIPLETGFQVIPSKSGSFSVMIKTSETYSSKLSRIQEKCEEAASGRAMVYSWKELNASQFENFSSTKVLLLFIMFLIVLVAAVNISSALVMLVMERRREIAILKSIGATSSGITVSFLITGLFCALAGLCIGLPAGIILALNSNGLISLIEKLVNFFAKAGFVLCGGKTEAFSSVRLLDPAYYLTEIPVSVPAGEILIICAAVILLSFVVSVLPALKAGRERPLDIFRKA